MPELPDIEAYLTALDTRIGGARVTGIRLASPFLLRSVDPPLTEFEGRAVTGLRRLGKRIAIGVEGDLWLVLHLMIAGRLHWAAPGAKIPGGKRGLAAFDFEPGSLILTEAGSKKRASLHAVRGAAEHDPGGIEPLEIDLDAFRAALTRGNHTLKRALTDPRSLAGIGNAYSDEILHRARLSPIALSQSLGEPEIERLCEAVRSTLTDWRDRLCAEAADAFPEKVTAFRPDMAVHGKFGEPCPDCGTTVQRIVYATNETNYCPACQTGGRVLADRSLSRLLKKDWPRSVEELEALGVGRRSG